MVQKHFTPQQANQTLPLVKRIVDDILGKARDVRSLMASGINPSNSDRHRKLIADMDELINELESLGCFYKDWNFEKGLVDFPSVIDGQEVLLCWHSDEPDIRFYHSAQEGFAGRQLIPEHMLAGLPETAKSHTDKPSAS